MLNGGLLRSPTRPWNSTRVPTAHQRPLYVSGGHAPTGGPTTHTAHPDPHARPPQDPPSLHHVAFYISPVGSVRGCDPGCPQALAPDSVPLLSMTPASCWETGGMLPCPGVLLLRNRIKSCTGNSLHQPVRERKVLGVPRGQGFTSKMIRRNDINYKIIIKIKRKKQPIQSITTLSA